MPRLLRIVASLCLLATQPLHAQKTLDATAIGQSVKLGPNWLFTPTDNPAYASPIFDDSAWTPITTQRELRSYGFYDFPNCWYRLHLHTRPEARDLAITTLSTSGRYQLYLNGILFGGVGDMTDHSTADQSVIRDFPIPNQILAESHGDLVLAIRFSVPIQGASGPGTEIPISSGTRITLLAQQGVPALAQNTFAHTYSGTLPAAILSLLVGCLTLTLFLALRDQPAYLAIAVCLLASAAGDFCELFAPSPASHSWPLWPIALCEGLAAVALFELARILLALPRRRTFRLLEYLFLLAPFSVPIIFSGPRLPLWQLAFILTFLPLLVIYLFVPLLLLRHWRSSLDARLLLPAILISGAAIYWDFLAWLAYFLHLSAHKAHNVHFHAGSYSISLGSAGNIVLPITILFFLVFRTIRITRERAHTAAEIAAAQSVQQLLLTRSTLPTPGFHVETVYFPASEVGGDFFLISPAPDGSLIAIVGDVSGKGLTAAMRVAMILGALRRETSRSPAEILANLNEALLAPAGGPPELGFTTALCLHLTTAGQYTIANAGHINPYLSSLAPVQPSQELIAPPSLPLGLAPGQTYETLTGHLLPAHTLVLLTDGVPEARNPAGNLYGFEALPTLTCHTATHIAATAQTFGQEDDITVLTLTLA